MTTSPTHQTSKTPGCGVMRRLVVSSAIVIGLSGSAGFASAVLISPWPIAAAGVIGIAIPTASTLVRRTTYNSAEGWTHGWTRLPGGNGRVHQDDASTHASNEHEPIVASSSNNTGVDVTAGGHVHLPRPRRIHRLGAVSTPS